MKLDLKELLAKQLEYDMVDVETLATGATLMRIGNMRVLSLRAYQPSASISIASADRPPISHSTIALKRSSAAQYSSLGFVRVNTDGTVDFYKANNYNTSTSLTAAATTDMYDGQIAWTTSSET